MRSSSTATSARKLASAVTTVPPTSTMSLMRRTLLRVAASG
jgi:hypothetical protein